MIQGEWGLSGCLAHAIELLDRFLDRERASPYFVGQSTHGPVELVGPACRLQELVSQQTVRARRTINRTAKAGRDIDRARVELVERHHGRTDVTVLECEVGQLLSR